MSKDKYAAQKKYITEKLKQFPIKLKPETLDAFKEACYKNNTTPTTEIRKFIDDYIKKYS